MHEQVDLCSFLQYLDQGSHKSNRKIEIIAGKTVQLLRRSAAS